MSNHQGEGLHALALKCTLPFVQLCVALALLTLDALWGGQWRHPWTCRAPRQLPKLLGSINAPLALLETFVFRHLPRRWDLITFVAAIGVFWYWVGMNIVSWREQRAAYLFPWTPLRLLADIMIIGLGTFLIVVCWKEIQRYNERLFSAQDWQDWLWYALSLALPILWGTVLITFFGYDCIHSLIRRKSA